MAEFYQDRQVEDDLKLKVSELKYGQFRITSVVDEDSLTEEENKDLVTKLPKRKQEMEEFGQFLKSKFLAGD